jgi:stearoyl-CoA desaturase (delta-9 desaturase)
MTTVRELDPPRARRTGFNWFLLFVLLAMHAAVFAAPFTFTWGALGVFLALHWLTASVGISLCFHRVLTHRSVQLARPVEIFVALCGCVAWQGSPIDWVATHRKHHSNTDREGDPHSPHPDFWWGHWGWLLVPNGRAQQEALYQQYASDLLADPFYRFLQWTYPFYQVLLGVGLYFWGGWSFVVWGIALRTVIVWHSTWLVNSATHKWGYRRFQTKENSTNLWWVAFLTYGEGWHNNHHGDPRSAVYGRRWWEFDPTWLVIRVLEFVRLARDVRRPKRAEMLSG